MTYHRPYPLAVCVPMTSIEWARCVASSRRRTASRMANIRRRILGVK